MYFEIDTLLLTQFDDISEIDVFRLYYMEYKPLISQYHNNLEKWDYIKMLHTSLLKEGRRTMNTMTSIYNLI